MRRRTLTVLSFFFASGAIAALAVVMDGCSSDDASGSGGSTTDASGTGNDGSPAEDAPSGNDAATSDGGTDAAKDAPVTSIACTDGKPVADAGETCTGFGQLDPCDKCTPAAYGYVCIAGGPPNIQGCLLVRASSFGETYCCPKNDCVAQPDQDSKCKNKAGTPHRYTCPPTNDAGAFAKPPAGCVDVSTGADPYPLYCCP